jgi:ribosome biogenesis SPOUT family RNA methylase Rps3
MGDDEAALLRLWREKRGEIEPEDLSRNLIVQLGVVTEHLNRHWYERHTGQVVTEVVARQSGWEHSDNQDGHFGGRGERMIVAARR